MKKKKVEKFIDKFAELYLNYQNKQTKAVKNLSDEDLKFLAKEFKKCAVGDPQTSFGFRTTFWDTNHDLLIRLLMYRECFKQAKDSNVSCYCFTCKGECRGEEEHDKIIPRKTEDEMRVGEMSRDDLIQEVLKWRKLNK